MTNRFVAAMAFTALVLSLLSLFVALNATTNDVAPQAGSPAPATTTTVSNETPSTAASAPPTTTTDSAPVVAADTVPSTTTATTAPPTSIPVPTTTGPLPGTPAEFGPAAGTRLGVVGVSHDDFLNVRDIPNGTVVGTLSLRLAHGDRPVQRAVAAGSVPPEMRQLWNRMESRGVEVRLFDRGTPGRGEQDMPDRVLQLRMLEDALDYNGTPGIVVLLTGDGAGYLEGAGFHSTLERMHKRGWRVEILSWAHSCNQRMRRWAEENGVFVALDDFYQAVTYMEPSRPGFELAAGRESVSLDLGRRPMADRGACRGQG